MALPPELVASFRTLAINEDQESDRLDFKEEFYPNGPNKKSEWSKIVKDVAAFANSGGGAIVFGCDSFGISTTFSPTELLTLDPARLTDQMNKYTGEHFSAFRFEQIRRKRKLHIVWFIGSVHIPLIFTNDAYLDSRNQAARPEFHRGQVYFRHGAKSEPGTPIDVRDFIEREVDRRTATIGLASNRPANLSSDTKGGVGVAPATASSPMTEEAIRAVARAFVETVRGTTTSNRMRRGGKRRPRRGGLGRQT